MFRRNFLYAIGGSVAASLAGYPLALCAANENKQAIALSHDEWRILQAICSNLIPPVNGVTTELAGCVNFIDKLLANEEVHLLDLYQDGLRALNNASTNRFRLHYVELPIDEQVKLLEQLEDAAITEWSDGHINQESFFETIRLHTILGFLAAPNHGGNHNKVGWKAIGFTGHLHETAGVTDQQVMGIESLPAHTL